MKSDESEFHNLNQKTMFKFLKELLSKDNSTIEQALKRGAVIIDVRTPGEFSQGHIQGSENIPLFEIRQKTEQIKEWNKPVITVCFSGSRSAAAKSVLANAGVEVYNGGSWSHLNNIKS
jgi:rhodanese-related sulfurtransferase